MSLVLGDVGAGQILKKYFNNTPPVGGNDYILKLYTNNIDPSDNDVASDYTEAVGGGYSDKTLTSGSFVISTVAGICQATYAQQEFAFSGPLTGNPAVYGYFVVDADGVFIFAEKAGASITPLAVGDKVTVDPMFQLTKGTPS
jgi:hypothetical protein